jgi:membrane protein required for colicin V production
MILDLIFAVIFVWAIFKGYQRGLIVGLFSFIAILIGLAAAIVFIIVVILVRLGANAIQRTVEIAMLGWLNRLGGIILYAALYITVFSVLLFYAEQVSLLKQATIDRSVTYSFVQPWGTKAINGFGAIVPGFKNMFAELEQFFGRISDKIS